MAKLFLDIETSGTDPIKHSILSIGMVVSQNEAENYPSFYEEIKYDEILIAPDAIAINEFEFKNQDGRISLEKADNKSFSFVKKYFQKNKKAMAIGLNIGEFDLLFINRYMPKLASLLDRRSVNLNSLIYLLADANSVDFIILKQDLSEKAVTQVDKLVPGLKKHNALYDAFYHLALYILIKDTFNITKGKVYNE